MRKCKWLFIIFIFLNINIINVSATEIDYIAGKNRYETAALIAQKMDYNKAILINATALVDGLSASGLSGAINAPILLTDAKSIPEVTIKALQRVDTVFLVGGEGVISKEVENILKKMNINIIRSGGLNRFSTSIAVAKEIEKVKGIQEIYYVNGITGQADAMSIAPVAASTGNPVILTDGRNTDYRLNVKSYIIGGNGVMNETFEAFAERISGTNRFLTNKAVINKFFIDKSHVYISKSDVLIDSLTSSVMKQPVVLVDNNSDKTVIAGANSATILGNVDPLAISGVKGYLFNEKVVFYVQHQDDETLFAGSAIIDAISSVGPENVFVVLVTDGANTEVFKQARYKNIDRNTKKTLRDNEFNSACSELGVYKSNILYLNEYDENCKFNNIVATAIEFENKFDGNVTHVAHSYKYDINNQHLQNGQIIYDLYKQGKISDVKFFANFNCGDKIPQESLILSQADNDNEKRRVINAINQYKIDNQDMVREGIGFKSVSELFNQLLNSKKVTSYLHEPGA